MPVGPSGAAGRWIRGISPRASGAVVGAMCGAAYTLQSSPHMMVASPYDKLGIGVILTVLGAASGWLAGAMIALASPSRLSMAARSDTNVDGQPSDQGVS